jgi:hypothetical protein
MNPLTAYRLFVTHSGGWRYLADSHLSILRMYFLYVVPLSLVPPLMIYFAGSNYADQLLPLLSPRKMEMLVVIFYLAELAIVPAMAWVIQQLSNAARINVSYHDAFMLAATAPTPLWIATLFLFVPNLVFNLAIMSLALLASLLVIYYAVPPLFHLEGERRQTIPLAGLIMFSGLLAWAFMMVLTLFTWNSL